VLIYAAVNDGIGLSQAARHTLLDGRNSLVISSLSLLELSNLTSRGRIPFTPKQIQLVLDSLRIDVLPFRQRHVER
jgi:PIN domain nuclease of toxin-antitoxin system